jgi:hypothetical protein
LRSTTSALPFKTPPNPGRRFYLDVMPRVPDAVQRSPGDANGSRECDDRLRIVRSRCSAEPGSILAVVMLWAPALRSTTPRRSAPRPGRERTRASTRRMGRALAKPITLQNHVMGIAALHPSYKLCFASRASTISRPSRDKTTRRANHPNPVQPPLEKYSA